MSSTSPSPSSSTDASASAATSTSTSSSPSSSPPIFVGFIGVGVLTLCLVSLCVWRRLIGRNHPFTPFYDPNERRPHNNDTVNGRPEMFDAWTGERVSDGLKWEESMPFSVTIFPGAESNRTSDAAFRKGKAGKHRSNSTRDQKKKEREDPGSSDLQVAVLVAMPSPFHAQSHDGADQGASGSSLRGELAIGLIEVPWIKEDRHSPKRNGS